MLDQSDNPNYNFFDSVVTSDLYFFQEIVFLNSCFIFSKNLTLSFIDNRTTET